MLPPIFIVFATICVAAPPPEPSSRLLGLLPVEEPSPDPSTQKRCGGSCLADRSVRFRRARAVEQGLVESDTIRIRRKSILSHGVRTPPLVSTEFPGMKLPPHQSVDPAGAMVIYNASAILQLSRRHINPNDFAYIRSQNESVLFPPRVLNVADPRDDHHENAVLKHRGHSLHMAIADHHAVCRGVAREYVLGGAYEMPHIVTGRAPPVRVPRTVPGNTRIFVIPLDTTELISLKWHAAGGPRKPPSDRHAPLVRQCEKAAMLDYEAASLARNASDERPVDLLALPKGVESAFNALHHGTVVAAAVEAWATAKTYNKFGLPLEVTPKTINNLIRAPFGTHRYRGRGVSDPFPSPMPTTRAACKALRLADDYIGGATSWRVRHDGIGVACGGPTFADATGASDQGGDQWVCDKAGFGSAWAVTRRLLKLNGGVLVVPDKNKRRKELHAADPDTPVTDAALADFGPRGLRFGLIIESVDDDGFATCVDGDLYSVQLANREGTIRYAVDVVSLGMGLYFAPLRVVDDGNYVASVALLNDGFSWLHPPTGDARNISEHPRADDCYAKSRESVAPGSLPVAPFLMHRSYPSVSYHDDTRTHSHVVSAVVIVAGSSRQQPPPVCDMDMFRYRLPVGTRWTRLPGTKCPPHVCVGNVMQSSTCMEAGGSTEGCSGSWVLTPPDCVLRMYTPTQAWKVASGAWVSTYSDTVGNEATLGLLEALYRTGFGRDYALPRQADWFFPQPSQDTLEYLDHLAYGPPPLPNKCSDAINDTCANILSRTSFIRCLRKDTGPWAPCRLEKNRHFTHELPPYEASKEVSDNAFTYAYEAGPSGGANGMAVPRAPVAEGDPPPTPVPSRSAPRLDPGEEATAWAHHVRGRGIRLTSRNPAVRTAGGTLWMEGLHTPGGMAALTGAFAPTAAPYTPLAGGREARALRRPSPDVVLVSSTIEDVAFAGHSMVMRWWPSLANQTELIASIARDAANPNSPAANPAQTTLRLLSSTGATRTAVHQMQTSVPRNLLWQHGYMRHIATATLLAAQLANLSSSGVGGSLAGASTILYVTSPHPGVGNSNGAGFLGSLCGGVNPGRVLLYDTVTEDILRAAIDGKSRPSGHKPEDIYFDARRHLPWAPGEPHLASIRADPAVRKGPPVGHLPRLLVLDLWTLTQPWHGVRGVMDSAGSHFGGTAFMQTMQGQLLLNILAGVLKTTALDSS